MSSQARIIVILSLVVLVGVLASLAMWDIPAPTTKIEKVIPDDRFQH